MPMEYKAKHDPKSWDQATTTITVALAPTALTFQVHSESMQTVEITLDTETAARMVKDLTFVLEHERLHAEEAERRAQKENSEDFKCNTCGDYVGPEGSWGLCDDCFDKEGGNEALEETERRARYVSLRAHLLRHRAAPCAWKDSWEMPRPRTLDIAIDAFNAMAQKDGGINGTDR